MTTRDQDILNETRWTRPDSYGGYNPEGHYCVASITRDATCLDESNWNAWRQILQDVGAEIDDSDNEPRGMVYTFRAGHWAVGWVEYLMIRPDAPPPILDAAAETLQALADYPVLDETDWSEREYTQIHEYWGGLSLRGRVQECSDAGVSIFAARRADDIPEAVFNRLRDGWQ